MEMHASRLFVSMKSSHVVLPRGSIAFLMKLYTQLACNPQGSCARSLINQKMARFQLRCCSSLPRRIFAISRQWLCDATTQSQKTCAGFCSSTRVRVQAALLPGCGRILQALSVRFVANVPAGSRAAEQGGCILWCAHDKVVARVTGTCGKPHVGASRCAASDLCRVPDGR